MGLLVNQYLGGIPVNDETRPLIWLTKLVRKVTTCATAIAPVPRRG